MAAKPAPKKSSIASALFGLLAVTAIAGGMGAAFSLIQAGEDPASKNAAPKASSDHAPRTPTAALQKVKTVPPILTTLLAPEKTFIRLEAALILDFDTPDADTLASKVGEDFVAYLRTVALSYIEGPTGFQYLRGDLLERAQQRSDGKVRDLAIQTLIIE